MKLPNKPQYSLHSNWLYGLVLEDEIDRDVVCNELLALGIETRPFFYPLHSMPPYRQFKRSDSLSTSISISKNGLSLPSSTSLSENELISISQSVIQILQGQIKNA